MADDIFDKMWQQLARIYDALHDGLVPRNSQGERQQINPGSFVLSNALRAFGLQDVSKLIGLNETSPVDASEDDAPGNSTARNPVPSRSTPRQSPQHPATAPSEADEARVAADDLRRLAKESGVLRTDMQALADSVRNAAGSFGGDPGKGPSKSESTDEKNKLDRISDTLETIADQLGTGVSSLAGFREEVRNLLRELIKKMGTAQPPANKDPNKNPQQPQKPAQPPKPAGGLFGGKK